MSWLRDLVTAMVGRGPREAGPRRSANGASSFHLIWSLPGMSARTRLVEVAATLEVLVPPQVDSLYFWALQVDLADERGVWGGAHTGLQWNRRYPGGGAVNWGGYLTPALGGGVLRGSISSLPGYPDDPHTLAYAWEPGRAYRLRVCASPDVARAWRADITDLQTGLTTVVRDLYPPSGRGDAAGYLTRPLVWSEVFAPCDAPSVTVRWSDLRAIHEDGTVLRPERVSVNYQAEAAGGCTNTSCAVDDKGLLQITGVPRAVAQDTELPVTRRA